jgi:TonB-linked SusC/RagA family outer membrane protein
MNTKNNLSVILMLIYCTISFAQEKTVSGTITEDSGIPLPGVNVMIKGTSSGAQSDFDGNYSLQVETGQTLVFSYLGFKTEEKLVGNESTVNVTMLEDATSLEQVVVTAFGITKSKKSLGYAQQTVKGENLNKTLEVDLNASLAGKVSGIQSLGSSGATFDGALVRLRGQENILYVVDGIKVQSSNDINTADVESISVLKGGAATALFGTEARGGVVIITSKKADRGEKSITVQQSTELANVYNLPKYQDEYGGGYSQDFIVTPEGELRPNYGADQSWGPRLDGTLVRHWDSWIEGDPEYGQLRPWSANPSNVKNFYKTGSVNKTIINFKNGGEGYNISSTARYIDQGGILPNSERQTLQISVNTDYEVSNKFKVFLNGNYQIRKTLNNPELGYTGSGSFFRPNQWWQRQLDIDRLRNYKRNNEFVSWNIQSPTNPVPAFWDSPFFEFYENRNVQKKNGVFGKFGGTYTFSDNLSATMEYRRTFNNFKYDRIGAFGSRGGETLPEFVESNISDTRDELFGIVNFDEKLGKSDSFTVSATAGFQTQDNTYERIEAQSVGGLTVPGFYNIESSVDRPNYENEKLNTKTKSIFGSATLGFNDIVYVDGSIRSDWSSTANPDDNRIITYGVSASFVFSNLFDNKDILTFGKLRGGISRAPQFPDLYNIFKSYESTGNFNGNPLLAVPEKAINPSLRGASNNERELGVELSFLNNRLGLDVTYFNIIQKDFPQDFSLPPSTGSETVQKNFGKETRSGFEITLNATPIKTENFTWNTSINFATLKWVVNEIDPTDDPNVPTSVVKERVSTFFGGDFANLKDIEGEEIGGIYGTIVSRDDQGRILIDPDIGDFTRGAIVTEDDKLIGNFLPDITGGFTNTFAYKGIELTTSIDFQIGGNFYSTTKRWLRGSGLGAETVGVNDNGRPIRDPISEGGGVRVDGVDVNTGQPITRYFDAVGYFSSQTPVITENLVFDASYVKLRQASLNYNLPENWYDSIGFKNIKAGIYANNLWLIYSATDGVDPSELENISGTGLGREEGVRRWAEGAQYPSSRTIGINVSLTF